MTQQEIEIEKANIHQALMNLETRITIITDCKKESFNQYYANAEKNKKRHEQIKAFRVLWATL